MDIISDHQIALQSNLHQVCLAWEARELLYFPNYSLYVPQISVDSMLLLHNIIVGNKGIEADDCRTEKNR